MPQHGLDHPHTISLDVNDVNRAHAIGERVVATFKSWKVLTKPRCCPHRAIALVQAILVPHLIKESRYSG